jgi:hypothetical protein
MKLGFTGTRDGMTPMQLLKVALFIAEHYITESHSGDCSGSDREFYDLITLANANKNFQKIKTFGHVPNIKAHRAFCKYDIQLIPKPYLERNHDIVNNCDFLIAAPKEKEEQLRSGTWSTVRFSKKVKKKGMIVFPDGEIEEFNI